MNKMGLLFVAILSLAQLANGQNDEAKELQKLEGTWRAQSREIEGHIENICHGELMVLRGNRAEIGFISFAVKVDGSTNPKGIDFTALSGPDKGKTEQAIYHLDGDKLTICRLRGADKTKRRPTELATKKGSEYVILVYSKRT